MVGTSVRDRMNDQIIANITASAIGTNRKRATPVRKNIGTNTMQMQSSDTKAGVTIWLAPPSVMMLSVSPIADSMMMAPSTESGIETAMMTVERQLPRNSRIMTLVSSAAITPSNATPSMAPRTNTDWSPMKPILSASGS